MARKKLVVMGKSKYSHKIETIDSTDILITICSNQIILKGKCGLRYSFVKKDWRKLVKKVKKAIKQAKREKQSKSVLDELITNQYNNPIRGLNYLFDQQKVRPNSNARIDGLNSFSGNATFE